MQCSKGNKGIVFFSATAKAAVIVTAAFAIIEYCLMSKFFERNPMSSHKIDEF